MAGYSLEVLFFGVFMDREGMEVYIHAQYPAILTQQAWSLKDLSYGKKKNTFFLARHCG